MSFRTHAPEEAAGGADVEVKSTAIVLIEFQNEFTTEGGKLYPAVKEVMEETKTLDNTVALVEAAKEKGIIIINAPITFNADSSNNPNKGLGILAGCYKDNLFQEGTWNAEICDALKDKFDFSITGKHGLDAFPDTDLEEILKTHGIKTVALGGFLTNCCVESTMRTAYEKGFNVFTLKDCTATTSKEGQKAAVDGTFGMFSTPITSTDFIELAK